MVSRLDPVEWQHHGLPLIQSGVGISNPCLVGVFCCPPALVSVDQPLGYHWKLDMSDNGSLCLMVWQVQTDQYIPEEDIYGQMDAIEHQLDQLEHRGVVLEEKLRSAENGMWGGLSVGVGQDGPLDCPLSSQGDRAVTSSLLMLGLEEQKGLCWAQGMVAARPWTWRCS